MTAQTARLRTHRYDIALYWALRGEFMIDIGEPSCFACHWYSRRSPICPEATPREVWKVSLLDRAHIVPRSLGGTDDPSNIVLLCKQCHDEAPDWSEPNVMLSWIQGCSASWKVGGLSYARVETLLMEMPPGDVDVLDSMAYSDLKDRMGGVLDGHASIHLGPYGPALSTATLQAALQTLVLDVREGLSAGRRGCDRDVTVE